MDNNDYIKKFKLNIQLLTSEYKRKNTLKYNIIKLKILCTALECGYIPISIFGPNNIGTGFLFKQIETDYEFQKGYYNIENYIMKIQKNYDIRFNFTFMRNEK